MIDLVFVAIAEHAHAVVAASMGTGHHSGMIHTGLVDPDEPVLFYIYGNINFLFRLKELFVPLFDGGFFKRLL